MNRTLFLILLLATLNAGFVPFLAAYAQPATMLYVYPPVVSDPTRVVGTTVTFDVAVKNVTDLYVFDFMLNYSTTILKATEISIGSFFPPDSMIWKQELNDTLGYVRYLVSLPLGTPQGHGLNGSGTLATITFTVLGFGEASLDLCKTELVDSYAEPIAHQLRNGHFSNVRVPPAITVLSPENKTYAVNAGIALVFTVDKSATWMGYSLNGQANVTITGNTTLPALSSGPHQVIVYANDTFGNMGMSTACFTVDTIPPTADAGSAQTVDEDTVVTFDGSASTDENGIATYTWVFTDLTPKTLSGKNPTYTFATPGTYTVTLEVADAVGNTATDTVTITVLDVTKPVANAGSDRTVNEDISTNLDGSASTDNVGVTGHTWTFTDVTVKTLTGDKPAYTFSNPGVFTITLNVSDATGNWATDTVAITVIDVSKPVANGGNDQTVNVGAIVTLDASGSSDNVGITKYEWDFGDGATGTGKTITHEYREAGTYSVTLTVEDAAGNQAVDTVVVTVNAAPAFPWWVVATAGIVVAGIVAGVAILWRRGKKTAR